MEAAVPSSGSMDQVDSPEVPTAKEKKKKNMWVDAFLTGSNWKLH
jgi:hypothetical protein